MKSRRNHRTIHSFLKPQTVTVPDGEALGYFAGIVDGEGCITVKDDAKRTLRIAVYNTNETMMKWLQAHVGGQVALGTDKRGIKPCFKWQVNRMSDVYVLLKALERMVIEKQAKVQEALALIHKRYGPEETWPTGILSV